ncbi:hypothetical protein PVAP13_9NG534400 [Panicum virgatum]|uniref:Exocyst complex component n=1 Tax=Panicum virgatum TaxID=38727 RepID=A0A8T0MUD9_PANVG|nr:hypothetical protein PVAP13_9NG534400 [Panicum virgatum]
MSAPPKKRTIVDSGDGGLGLGIAAFITNGEDLALMHNLRSIVKKKEVEIEELCRLHYEDFIVAVDELRGVLVDAEELKGVLSGENSHLQEASTTLLFKLDELLEIYLVKKNVGEAIATLKICVKVFSLCLRCNNYIAEAKFHPALKTLDMIQKGYLNSIPLKLLKKVVARQIPLIKLHIEKKVCSEFNDWLVHIRRMAKHIGQVSINQASLARQKDEEIRARQREAEGHSHAGPDEHLYSLNLENKEEESALDFDVTPVYRTHHMHICLGIGEKFRDYYYKNRLMQLNLDMQISTSQPFLESHQPFLSQSQVETTWETAIAKITSILEEQFSRMRTASHFLLIKDYGPDCLWAWLTRCKNGLLARLRRYERNECIWPARLVRAQWMHIGDRAAVNKYGYQITQLIEVLEKSGDRYHQLLLLECRKQIDDILTNDSYEQMVIKKEYEYNMNVKTFHLEHDDVIPDFPYVAPFSSFVPEVCRIVRSFIEDSVSYLSYGGLMNIYDVVKVYLDRLLIEVLNDSLLNMIYARSLAMSQMMQLAGNISVLDQACDMYLLHSAHLCGIPKRVAERSHSGLTARAVLKASQNALYNSLINSANFKVDEFMVLLENVSWIAEEAPDDANDYMNEVLIYLETLVSTAQSILPLEALYKVVSGAISHISDSIMTTLRNDGVKRFTVNAVLGLDIDLKMLEAFADEKFDSIGLSDLGKETTFRDCLVEIRQLVNLLLSSQPENFMNPKKVAIVCDKYKDSTGSLFGSLSNRNVKQNARKKSMDVLKRRLKDFS